ncbi:MAG TPA: lamin tail domain-containing protein [Rubricoccaceae bacterium]|jgi:hypothetical protein
MRRFIDSLQLWLTASALLIALALPVHAQSRGDIVVTELFSNPGGTISDANGEWVELYNATPRPINLQGWAVRDSSGTAPGVRPFHVIASSVVIQPFGYVVLGTTTNTTNNGGVPVDYAYGAAMAFANSFDRFQLFLPDQTTLITEAFYLSAAISAQNGISRERRSVLGTDNNMDGANWADATVTAVYGPGGRGTPKAENSTAVPVATIAPSATTTAGAGWRILSPPVRGLTAGSLAEMNLVQGLPDEFPNAVGPNVFTGYSGDGTAGTQGYTAPASKSTFLQPGRGVLWYMYAEGGPGPNAPDGTSRRAALPLALQRTGYPRSGSVATRFTATERTGTPGGAYMLGNPFETPFDLDGLSVSSGTLSNVVQLYDPALGYVMRTRAGGISDGDPADDVAVWQGFFAEFTAAPTLPVTFTYDAGARTVTTPTFVGKNIAAQRVALTLDGATAAGPTHDEAATLWFSDAATAGWDADDASKLAPLASPSATLAPVGPGADGRMRTLAQRSLPAGLATTVPVAFATTHAGRYTLSATVPAGWAVTLEDRVAGTTTPLGDGASYTFDSDAATAGVATGATERFAITVAPRTTAADEAPEAEVALAAVAPNPSASGAQTVLRVREAQTVRAEVYDVLGRQVQTVFAGPVAAGVSQALDVTTGTLPAGTYVLRVTGATFTETQTFSVVR